jgi:hypothetical protein
MKMLLLAIVSLIAPLIGSGSILLANDAAFVFATAPQGRSARARVQSSAIPLQHYGAGRLIGINVTAFYLCHMR